MCGQGLYQPVTLIRVLLGQGHMLLSYAKLQRYSPPTLTGRRVFSSDKWEQEKLDNLTH